LPDETRERCFNEWYTFEQPVAPVEMEAFVNWVGFRLDDPKFKWWADRLWDQMARLAPESYIAEGSVFMFVTPNASLFANVLAFSANTE
jgi:hypothetical protein